MKDGHLKFVPLKDFVARAKGDPLLVGILKKALQRIGFDGEEVLKLFETGKSTFKGTDVTIDDVSKFCCPLGVWKTHKYTQYESLYKSQKLIEWIIQDLI